MIAENIAATAILVLGLLGLIKPHKVAKVTSIAPVGHNGVSEIRATYGGLFIGMGLWCLISQSQIVFCTAGLSWIGAAMGRLFSILFDRNIDRKNIGGFTLEFLKEVDPF